MDMVYTDTGGTEVGILQSFQLDLAYGEDENDFSVKIPYGLPIGEGSLCYIDDTEWGGIVRGFREDATEKPSKLYAVGQTWHGLLAETVLCPPAGATHITFKGEANEAIAYVLRLTGRDILFSAEAAPSGMVVDYQFDRFCTLYDGLRKMLSQIGGKLKIAKEPGQKPKLYAAPATDYTDGERALRAGYIAERVRPVNHLVCTGEGEDDERIVIHLYADEEGGISRAQTLFGAQERAAHYDYTSADESKLIEDGTKRLKEMQESASLEIKLPSGTPLDVGDKVGIVSEQADIEVSADVSKVIVVIGETGKPSISYKTSANDSMLYTKG